MMRAFRRIWKDIQQGENIDLYVTVAIALFLAVLNITGFAPQTWVAPLTLAVLALLAIATLGNRHRLEAILERTAQTAEKVFLEHYPPELERDLERASELWVLGVNLSATLKYNYTLFKEKLERGDSIKVLVVNPDGAACAMAAMRYPGRVDVERERTLIRSTLNDLCDLLKKVPNSKLEFRTIEDPLQYGGFMVDPYTSDGVIYLRRYSYKPPDGVRPRFVYRPRDRRWYDFIRSEIHELWKHATPWECKHPPSKS